MCAHVCACVYMCVRVHVSIYVYTRRTHSLALFTRGLRSRDVPAATSTPVPGALPNTVLSRKEPGTLEKRRCQGRARRTRYKVSLENPAVLERDASCQKDAGAPREPPSPGGAAGTRRDWNGVDRNPLNEPGTPEPTRTFRNEKTRSPMRYGGMWNLKMPPHQVLMCHEWGTA